MQLCSQPPQAVQPEVLSPQSLFLCKANFFFGYKALAFASSVIQVTHFGVLRGEESEEEFKFKAGALRRINQSLEKKNITDEIIVAILCLCGHEVSG
jgi:hypothetical protein